MPTETKNHVVPSILDDGGNRQIIYARNTFDDVVVSDLDDTEDIGSHVHYYCVCDTAADVAAKEITVGNGDSTGLVKKGASFIVTFTNGNTATGATLSVNGGTAYSLTDVTESSISTGQTVTLLFDGTNFITGAGSGGTKVEESPVDPGEGEATTKYVAMVDGSSDNSSISYDPSYYADSDGLHGKVGATTVDFTDDAADANTDYRTSAALETGNSLSSLFQKVKKIFAGMGSLAFKSSVGTTELDATLSDAYTNRLSKSDLYNGTDYSGGAGNKALDASVGVTLQNSITSLNSKVVFRDGSAAITGRQQLAQGSWVHRCGAGSGTNGYWRICQIDITGTYCNQPIEITYTQRGNNQTCHLYIRFASANNRTPSLESLTYRGTTSGAYSVTSGSTTSIYVKKSEAYDQLGVLEFLKDSYDAFTVTWKDEFLSSLPSGYKTATQVFSPGTANTAQVLTGYTFSSANGTNLSGTMPNRGNLNWSGSNTTYSVPAGWYSGGTLDSRGSYNNGYSAGNSAGYNNGYNAGVSAGKNTALSIKSTTVNAGKSAGTAKFPTWEGGTKNVQYRRANYNISGTIHAIFMYGSSTENYPVLYCRAANMIFTAKSAGGYCKFKCNSPAYVNNTSFVLPLYEKSGPGSVTFTAIIYYSS